MKTLISGIALILLFLQFNIFQLDFDSHLRALEELKFQAEDCAVAGAMCTKNESYSFGNIIYDIDDSESKIRSLLIDNMKLDDEMNAKDDSWWVGQVNYNVYYYDDSGYCTKMCNGKEMSKDPFSYGKLYCDEVNGYKYLVKAPTVIVRLEVDSIRHRTRWVDWVDLVRVASYEYDG